MHNLSPLFADISSNNNMFDAQRYARAGYRLVAIKATEGDNYVNPDHRSWSLHAGMNHVGVVHYHFARPDVDSNAELEAQHFLRTALPLCGGRDYLALDLERATPEGWDHDPDWSRQFDAYVAQHSRFDLIIYAPLSLLQSSPDLLVGSDRRVWVPDWTQSPPAQVGRYRTFAHQFTDGVHGPGPHRLTGVGRCDVNRMSADVLRSVRAHGVPSCR